MGVYINMKMPKSRPEQTYLMVFPSGEVMKIRYADNMVVAYGRAIEIPPHGRLIDADALMENAQYKGKHDIVTAYDIVAALTIIESEGSNED